MYAIIATGGKQYKVAEGDIINVVATPSRAISAMPRVIRAARALSP